MNQTPYSEHLTKRRLASLTEAYTPATLAGLLPFADGIIDFPESAEDELVNKFLRCLFVSIAELSFQHLDSLGRQRNFAMYGDLLELVQTGRP